MKVELYVVSGRYGCELENAAIFPTKEEAQANIRSIIVKDILNDYLDEIVDELIAEGLYSEDEREEDERKILERTVKLDSHAERVIFAWGVNHDYVSDYIDSGHFEIAYTGDDNDDWHEYMITPVEVDITELLGEQFRQIESLDPEIGGYNLKNNICRILDITGNQKGDR